MTKFLLSTMLLVLITLSAFSQCPSSRLFDRQSTIDNFPAQYPGCTDISGTVTINEAWGYTITNLDSLKYLNSVGELDISTNDNLTSLEGLNQLTQVNGDLTIYTNDLITDLSGLDNLQTVSGQLRIRANDNLTCLLGLDQLHQVDGNFRVENHTDLTTFDGLNSLSFVGGHFLIFDNNALQDILSLHTLSSIGSYLNIQHNPSLQELIGLDALGSIGSYLQINNNDALPSLSGLEMLSSVGWFLSVEDNDNLSSLQGLDAVNSIDWYLSIDNNPNLDDITALSSLTSIANDLIIRDNSSLTSLSGLDNLDHTTIDDLTLTGNGNLSLCHVQSICDYLDIPTNPASISSNTTDCNTRQEVEDLCAIILPVELSFFSGQETPNGILLNWETASEINNEGFEIQHSVDGNDWQKIGFEVGHGNTQTAIEYQFLHNRPALNNYYRLKQIDFDKNTEYSDIIVVKSHQPIEVLKFWPNPVRDLLHLNEQIAFYEIFNSQGSSVKTDETNQSSIHVSQLSTGLYILKAQNASGIHWVNFIVN